MSIFSGKTDLCDHIGFEKTYDKGSYSVSDELECFEIFKRRTGGKMYQHHKITVSEWNQDYVKQHCPGFDYVLNTKEVEDKRSKTGKREVKYYTYKYYDKEYPNLKELNKQGIYITVEITFKTLLDIIPYYPYLVSACISNGDEEKVYISHEPYSIQEFKDALRSGGHPRYPNFENIELQAHYLEVCQNYFFYKLEERTKQISLLLCKPLHNGYYELLLDKPVDYMHEPKFIWKDGNVKPHWTSPKVSDTEDNVILISEQDYDDYLKDDIKNNNIVVEYVEKCEFPNEARDK